MKLKKSNKIKVSLDSMIRDRKNTGLCDLTKPEEPDKSGAPYKAWEDFGYHPNGSLRK